MDVKLPNLGEGADSGTVVNILVKGGDTIAAGQPIIELESEKAVATLPSPSGGVVGEIFVKVGDKVSVGQRLLSLGDVAAPAAAPAAAAAPAPTPAGAPATPAPAVPVAAPAGATPAPAAPAAPLSPGVEPAAAPSIRRIARELGIDLTQIRGSESGGRIVMADLKAYIAKLQTQIATPKPTASAPAAPAALDFAKWGEISKKPMSTLRKVIAQRMSENWSTIPHVTQFDEADITALLELRKKFAPAYEAKGTRLTLTSFVLKAVATTLKKHPIFNSSLDEAASEIVLKEYVHLGLAVDTDAGLMVPVIRDADKKSLLELSLEIEALAKKARDRKVSIEEMKGGTFTISNQGGIGGAHFTPIINKPEVAILGLGKGALKPVIREKQIVQRILLPIAVSYDHRVIDGGSAVRFTIDLVAALETFTEKDAELA